MVDMRENTLTTLLSVRLWLPFGKQFGYHHQQNSLAGHTVCDTMKRPTYQDMSEQVHATQRERNVAANTLTFAVGASY